MPSVKKLLTMDDLLNFCESQHFSKFSSKDSGYRIAVQVPATFEVEESDDLAHTGLMKLKFKVCHTEKNRNNSYISEENMTKAMPSLKNRPILGYIHQLDDGTYDFYGHNMKFKTNENGKKEVEYLERQIGSFTEDDPVLIYDEEQDKTYVEAYGVIPEEYTKAADIIREKKGSKNSCELAIDSFTYNGKEKCIELVDFYFSGSTLLGSDDNGNEILEGMAGARADISDFAESNNSVFSKKEIKEGGNELLEKLLEKYGKETKDLTFDYKGLSDEELKEAFKKNFDLIVDVEEPGVDAIEEAVEDEDDDDDDEDDESEEEAEEEESDDEDEVEEAINNALNYALNAEKTHKVTFELSLNDISNAIYALTTDYRNDTEWCYPCEIFETYFIMHDWDNEKFYKQSYAKDDDDNITLQGDREEMFSLFVNAEEKATIEKMRSNYSTMEAELNKYKAAELNSQKDAVLADPNYAEYLETEAFTELNTNRDNYSVEEFTEKAEVAFAKCVKTTGSFELKNTEEKATRHTLSKGTDEVVKKEPYGNLFSKN